MSFDDMSERGEADGDEDTAVSIAGSDVDTFQGVVEDIEVALTPESAGTEEDNEASTTIDLRLECENSVNAYNLNVASERLSATPGGGLSSCGSSGRSACSEVLIATTGAAASVSAVL